MRRQVTDLQLARRCWDVGLAGFALKSHYVPTAERAAVLNEALGGEVRVLGALTLNASVGGLNPIAVEIAAREGARILWMPTLDAANHRAKHADLPPGATPPMWLALQRDLDAQGVTVPVVDVLDEAGRPLPATREVLRLAARHQLVVATGHLSAYESRVVAEAAFEAGVRHVIATHPEFPQQDMSLDDQLALAGQGAFLERCFTTPFTGKYEWARMVGNIRATGAEHTIITTDLGQPHNPPVEDGLPLMADALQAAGFTDEEITTMIVSNSRLLAGADARHRPAAPASPETLRDHHGRIRAAARRERPRGRLRVAGGRLHRRRHRGLRPGPRGVPVLRRARRVPGGLEAAGHDPGPGEGDPPGRGRGGRPGAGGQHAFPGPGGLSPAGHPGPGAAAGRPDARAAARGDPHPLPGRPLQLRPSAGRRPDPAGPDGGPGAGPAVGAPGARRAAGVPLRAAPARDVRVPAGRAGGHHARCST